MKLIEVAMVVFAVTGIHFAGCDSESMVWFYWSKVIAAGLLGILILLCKRMKV